MSCHLDEKEAYQLLNHASKRISTILGNMGIEGMTERIRTSISTAENIMTINLPSTLSTLEKMRSVRIFYS